MTKCLGAREKTYSKGENVYAAGDFVREIGIVLDGRVHVVRDDAWGNRRAASRL
jgi:CRP-like cAMP-binding protein